MNGESFRFLHAGNFHLETPLHGLSDAPDHLRDLLINAPFAAAENVFQEAVAHECDFIVLSGDLLDPARSGPRAVAFLIEQFERLRKQEMPVYWATGRSDATSRWFDHVTLPSNVHLFAPGKVEELTFFRQERPVATVLGRGWDGNARIRPSEFRVDPVQPFRVAVVNGQVEPGEIELQPLVQYWALGGLGFPKTLVSQPNMAHYAGSPQGFSPDEPGPHGATLVQVNRDGQVRTRLVETDAVRWQSERINVGEGTTRDELQRLLRGRVDDLTANTPDRPLLVSWQLTGGDRLSGGVRRETLAAQVRDWLRDQFGHQKPAVWSASIRFETPERLPDHWFEEDTLLGDFLRTLRALRDDRARPLDIAAYLPVDTPAELAEVLRISDPKRDEILREAAILGVDLLRGETATIEVA